MTEEKKTCFIITPIGQDGSDIRIEIDSIIEEIVEEVLRECGYSYKVSHKIDSTGSINKEVINSIKDSDLAIANLTGLNPNVMYELGVRHTFGKETIIICNENTTLPFDLKDERTIFYKDSIRGGADLKNSLQRTMNNLNGDVQSTNPVYNAVQFKPISIDNVEDEKGMMKLILNEMNNVKRMLNNQRFNEKSNKNLQNGFPKLILSIKYKTPKQRDNLITLLSNIYGNTVYTRHTEDVLEVFTDRSNPDYQELRDEIISITEDYERY